MEVGSQIAGQHHDDAGIGGGGSQQHRVNGPSEIGQVPGDVEPCHAQAAVVVLAEARDEGLDAAAGQAAMEAGNELAGAAGEFRAVNKVRDP